MARNNVRRSSGFTRRSPGRLTLWGAEAFGTDFVALPAASFLVLSSLTAAGLALRPFTITRTVGLLAIRSDQAAAVEFPFGAVGGMVVSEKAANTGATAIPDPVTESQSDEWFLYQQWAAGGDASTNVGQTTYMFPFDSRAQRKVQDGEDFVFVIANSSATDGASFVFNLRFLLKLS